ncbi:immunoglobulin-like domain-containing protein [Specibacter sp. NPDC078692]|uniref:immunoglobulin-like domain-containing protein n=1 Tax=Specibacter sp. NPDC078692 TaxID=3155818 RepID=UPI003433722D
MRSKIVASALAGALMLASLGLGAIPAQSADDPAGTVTDGLTAWYKLDETSGTAAADSTGTNPAAQLKGAAAFAAGEGVKLDGGTSYVALPNDLLAGHDAVSISYDVWIDADQGGQYFIYGLGNTTSGAGDGYLFNTGNYNRATIASGNWSTEQVTGTSGKNLDRGRWVHSTYTQVAGTGVLYTDGVEVARNAAVTTTPASIGGGKTSANYLGKSVYPGDKTLKGKMRDFRIYDRAVTAAEAARLALPVNQDYVAADKAAIDLGDLTAVVSSINLPTRGAGGSAISWATSAPASISETGAVTRPAPGEPDAEVTLTASITHGSLTETATFQATVKTGSGADADAIEESVAALEVVNLGDVRGNLNLPGHGRNDTWVSWTSSNPAVISEDGTVVRPARGTGDTSVTLTATVERNGVEGTREFTAVVREAAAPVEYAGYAFSYFKGEGSATGEQIYFGKSVGNNPLQWEDVNNSEPVLTSTMGEMGVRDPFIIRSPEGDKFYMIATDLKINGSGDWGKAQTWGSRNLMVWESNDLATWSEQRSVQVSGESAGNTWAPEAYYDDELGAYVVFWSSKIYATADHSDGNNNRIMYATTRDFVTFSDPEEYYNPGYQVIDTTMIKDNGNIYRFTKDERNRTADSPEGKTIFMQRGAGILDADSFTTLATGIGEGTISAGEGPTVFKSNTEEKWYLFIDEFGGRGYVPFETTDLDSGQWTPSGDYKMPTAPRHGSVVPVTAAEMVALAAIGQPVVTPTATPSPTADPSPSATTEPTVEPTTEPTTNPTTDPTADPTESASPTASATPGATDSAHATTKPGSAPAPSTAASNTGGPTTGGPSTGVGDGLASTGWNQAALVSVGGLALLAGLFLAMHSRRKQNRY